MTSIQTIATIFSLIMLYLTFLHYKRKEFSSYQFFVWAALFIGFMIVVWLPDRVNLVTEQLGISRAFDLFAIVAFVAILFLTFHNYLLIARLEKRLEKRVRDVALEDLPDK